MSNLVQFRRESFIAESARVSSLAAVGTPGEDRRKRDHENRGVSIGERTVIREFATVHGGFEQTTRVGNDCYLMVKSHVGHDCVLHDGVTVCSGALLGGHTIVHEGATVGLGAVVHQRVTIGAYAFVGAGAVVIRDVPPFAKVVGNPAKVIGVNRIGMERAGFADEEIRIVEDCWMIDGVELRDVAPLWPDRPRDAVKQFARDAGRHK